jgi:hypothetical protein
MFSRLFGNSEKTAPSEGEQIQVVDPATIRA